MSRFFLTCPLFLPGNGVQVEFEYFGDFFFFFLRIPDAWQLSWRSSGDIQATYGQANPSDFMCTCRPSVRPRCSKPSTLWVYFSWEILQKKKVNLQITHTESIPPFLLSQRTQNEGLSPKQCSGLLPYYRTLHQMKLKLSSPALLSLQSC